jgi:hypothetical protein
MPLDDKVSGLPEKPLQALAPLPPLAGACGDATRAYAAYVNGLEQAASRLADDLRGRYDLYFEVNRQGMDGKLCVRFPAGQELKKDSLIALAARHSLAIGKLKRLDYYPDKYVLIANGKHDIVRTSRAGPIIPGQRSSHRLVIIATHALTPIVLDDLLNSYYRIPLA